MEVIISPTTEAAESFVADELVQFIAVHPEGRLGVATGRTFERIYRRLAEKAVSSALPLRGLSVYLLDEYVGLPRSHPQRFRNVIRRQLADRTDLKVDNIVAPDPDASDLSAAAEEFEEAISARGGIQLQLLGIGSDGHVAFNEPGSSLKSRTRSKVLMDRTRRDNGSAFSPDEIVPTQAITQGIGTILDAERILLVAMGENKAPIVRQAIEGPVTASVPASAIQFHEHATVILDAAAASQLERTDYYLHARQIARTGQDHAQVNRQRATALRTEEGEH
jgi:glucosamine-6-phosphate deaminase